MIILPSDDGMCRIDTPGSKVSTLRTSRPHGQVILRSRLRSLALAGASDLTYGRGRRAATAVFIGWNLRS